VYSSHQLQSNGPWPLNTQVHHHECNRVLDTCTFVSINKPLNNTWHITVYGWHNVCSWVSFLNIIYVIIPSVLAHVWHPRWGHGLWITVQHIVRPGMNLVHPVTTIHECVSCVGYICVIVTITKCLFQNISENTLCLKPPYYYHHGGVPLLSTSVTVQYLSR